MVPYFNVLLFILVWERKYNNRCVFRTDDIVSNHLSRVLVNLFLQSSESQIIDLSYDLKLSQLDKLS